MVSGRSSQTTSFRRHHDHANSCPDRARHRLARRRRRAGAATDAACAARAAGSRRPRAAARLRAADHQRPGQGGRRRRRRRGQEEQLAHGVRDRGAGRRAGLFREDGRRPARRGRERPGQGAHLGHVPASRARPSPISMPPATPPSPPFRTGRWPPKAACPSWSTAGSWARSAPAGAPASRTEWRPAPGLPPRASVPIPTHRDRRFFGRCSAGGPARP